jgi:hypothetical protein
VNRSFFVALFFLSIAVAVCAQNPPEVYSSKDGNFSVRFPSKPKETTQTTKTDLGELNVFTATYATSDGSTYMVSYTDFPAEAAKPENRDVLYDGVRDELKKDGKVLTAKDKEIGAKKLPGREIDIERDKGKLRLRFRVVLHDGRLFQVAVIGTPKFVDGKDATGFLESFEVTNTK